MFTARLNFGFRAAGFFVLRAGVRELEEGMSLDVGIVAIVKTYTFTANVTHNLVPMAEEAGIYLHLWRPEEVGIKKAGELIKPLYAGLEKLRAAPEEFKKLNPSNGWGSYDGFVKFVSNYLVACEEHPDGEIEACR